jgi:UDP-glucose 4-epimerase
LNVFATANPCQSWLRWPVVVAFLVQQVIQACEKVAGQKILTVEKPRRPGDPPRLVASAEKAIRDLGWRPNYPKLEDIVATAWAWHKKHPTGYPD